MVLMFQMQILNDRSVDIMETISVSFEIDRIILFQYYHLLNFTQ